MKKKFFFCFHYYRPLGNCSAMLYRVAVPAPEHSK